MTNIKKLKDDAYYISEWVFTGRSNIFSSVIEAYCPDWPPENKKKKAISSPLLKVTTALNKYMEEFL